MWKALEDSPVPVTTTTSGSSGVRWRMSAQVYRRIARRRSTKRAIVAVGRSILIIIWYLLPDPTVRYQDLGPGFYDTRINAERRKRNHIRQLEALGYKVTLEPAA